MFMNSELSSSRYIYAILVSRIYELGSIRESNICLNECGSCCFIARGKQAKKKVKIKIKYAKKEESEDCYLSEKEWKKEKKKHTHSCEILNGISYTNVVAVVVARARTIIANLHAAYIHIIICVALWHLLSLLYSTMNNDNDHMLYDAYECEHVHIATHYLTRIFFFCCLLLSASHSSHFTNNNNLCSMQCIFFLYAHSSSMLKAFFARQITTNVWQQFLMNGTDTHTHTPQEVNTNEWQFNVGQPNFCCRIDNFGLRATAHRTWQSMAEKVEKNCIEIQIPFDRQNFNNN